MTTLRRTTAAPAAAARIDLRIAVSQHDVTWLEHLAAAGRKVRVTIRSNAYVAQCEAHLDVLDPVAMKWNRVAYLPVGTMKTLAGMCYSRTMDDASRTLAFAADRAALLELFAQLAA